MRESLEATIEALRRCNAAQGEVIMNLEQYQRAIAGLANEDQDLPTGLANGYAAEIDYLTFRRDSLEVLIASVEKYGRMAAVDALIDEVNQQQ